MGGGEGDPEAGRHQPNGKDDEHVSINYEVEDTDGDLMTVSVKVSDHGEKTFHIVQREQLSGDVGGGISSERRKEYRR